MSRTTTYAYDLAGHPTEVIDPVGSSTVTAYDADGRVTSVADPRVTPPSPPTMTTVNPLP